LTFALACVVLLATVLGCKKSSDGADGGAAASSAAPSATPASTGASSAGAPKGGPAAAGGGITIDLKNVQVFIPSANERVMPGFQDDGFSTFGYGTKPKTFGVGVLVDAENATGELLHNVSVKAEAVFKGSGRELRCELSPRRAERGSPFVSLTPPKAGAKPGAPGERPWRDESDSSIESQWRPGERIRFVLRGEECDSEVLLDLGVAQVTGSIVVKARKRLPATMDDRIASDEYEMWLADDVIRMVERPSRRVWDLKRSYASDIVVGPMDASGKLPVTSLRLANAWSIRPSTEIESAPATFTLPGQAISLQKVKLPLLGWAFASGGSFVAEKGDGTIQRGELGKVGVSLATVEREDVPEKAPMPHVQLDELTVDVIGVKLLQFGEMPAGTPKGRRELDVSLRAAVATGNITARLQAAVDSAASPAAKTSAESALKRGADPERKRLAGQFGCASTVLVTNKGQRNPVEPSDATAACRLLDSQDQTELTLRYALDRYEIPVGLIVRVGKPSFQSLASAELVRFDPR
jgi:hypothetical protein